MAVKVELNMKPFNLSMPKTITVEEAVSFAITPNGDLVLLLPPDNKGFRSFAKGCWIHVEVVLTEL